MPSAPGACRCLLSYGVTEVLLCRSCSCPDSSKLDEMYCCTRKRVVINGVAPQPAQTSARKPSWLAFEKSSAWHCCKHVLFVLLCMGAHTHTHTQQSAFFFTVWGKLCSALAICKQDYCKQDYQDWYVQTICDRMPCSN